MGQSLPMSALRTWRDDRELRRFTARILVFAATVLLLSGWFFLMAGTGLPMIVLSVVLFPAAVVADPSRQTIALTLAGFVAGCAPIIALAVWAIT